jgi:hypothetical protein
MGSFIGLTPGNGCISVNFWIFLARHKKETLAFYATPPPVRTTK